MNALPDSVIHADWSVSPRNRWSTAASLQPDSSYLVDAPTRVTDPTPLREAVEGQRRLLGLDVTIGLPRLFAKGAGITVFLPWLSELGRPPWDEVFTLARAPDEISIRRPFYPARPGGARHRHLLEALGMSSIDDLLRACERRPPLARRASPLFWTLGAAQVGRASVSAWRDVVMPAHREGAAVWPFDGSLTTLTATRRLTIVEAYPAELGVHLGVVPAAKLDRATRSTCASAIIEVASRVGAELSAAAVVEARSGFTNDHAFDSFVGALGMLNVLRGNRPADPPVETPDVRTIEGWILGVG